LLQTIPSFYSDVLLRHQYTFASIIKELYLRPDFTVRLFLPSQSNTEKQYI